MAVVDMAWRDIPALVIGDFLDIRVFFLLFFLRWE